MRRVDLFLLAVLLTVSIGCGRSRTVVDSEGGKATVTQKGGGTEITYEGKGGEKVTIAGGETGVALPAGFPKDVPIYPGSTVAASAVVKEATQVSLTTHDPLAKVAAFYKEKLKAGGWQSEGEVNTAESAMQTAKKDRRNLTVTVARDSDQTMVNLIVTQEKE